MIGFFSFRGLRPASQVFLSVPGVVIRVTRGYAGKETAVSRRTGFVFSFSASWWGWCDSALSSLCFWLVGLCSGSFSPDRARMKASFSLFLPSTVRFFGLSVFARKGPVSPPALPPPSMNACHRHPSPDRLFSPPKFDLLFFPTSRRAQRPV